MSGQAELGCACTGVDSLTIAAWCKTLEKAKAVKHLFRALDKNADGKVMPAEFLMFLRASLGNHNATLQQAEQSLAFKDKNKDGSLSEVELKTACDGVDALTIVAWCESLEKARAVKRSDKSETTV